ncbi:glycosyltransferase family 4 protein [Cellulomonas sp. P5_C5]
MTSARAEPSSSRSGADLVVVAATEFDGGAERYIVRMLEGMAAIGADAALAGSLVPHVSGAVVQLPLELGPKWRLRAMLGGLARAPMELRRVHRLAATTTTQAYNVHFKREQVLFTRALARSAKVAWVEHGTFPAGLFGTFLTPFYRRAARHAHVIVCVSERTATSIRAVVGDRGPVVVVPTGLDVSRRAVTDPPTRAAARALLGAPDGLVAAYVGRLEPGKRPATAIEGALLAGATVLVAGEGALRGDLEAAFAGRPVMFLGQLPDASVVYQASDVHLFPSDGRGEGFPTVLLEAALHGVPSVVAADSGSKETAEEGCGVVAGATAVDFAAAIQRVVDGGHEYRDAAVEWVEGYSLRRWLDGLRRAFGVDQ